MLYWLPEIWGIDSKKKTRLQIPRSKYVTSEKFRADEARDTAELELKTEISRRGYDSLGFALGETQMAF